MGNYQSRQIIPGNAQKLVRQPLNASSVYLSLSLPSLEEYFILENPKLIHFQLRYSEIFFIWLEPRAENNEHLQTRRLFKQNLPQFTYYQTFEEVKQFLNKQNGNTIFRFIVSGAFQNQTYRFISRNRYVDELIIFAQNRLRIDNIQIRNKKARAFGFTLTQVMRLLPMPSNYQNNVLFFFQEDLSSIKKYCLNYYSFVHHRDTNQSKQDFIKLASIMFENNVDSIKNFQRSFLLHENNEEEKKNILQSLVYLDSFYWKMVSLLPKVTSDPKRLGYLRFAFKDLFKMILRSYRQAENRTFDIVFAVTELSETEISFFNENHQNFMMFTSFVKAFKNVNNANACYNKMKTPNKRVCILEISLPKRKLLKEDLDFGFMIADKMLQENPQTPTILFNIFNVFKIGEIKDNRICLTYGALAKVYKAEEELNSRQKMDKNEKQLLKNFNIFESIIRNVKDQIGVYNQLRCYTESIILSQSAIANLCKAQDQGSSDQRDLILLQKGDSEKLNGNLNHAIQTYLLIKNNELKILGMIRIVGIQLERNNFQQAQFYFEQVLPRIDQLQKQLGLYEENFLARHYHSILKINRKQYKQAYQSMKLLKDEIIYHFDYKIGTVKFFDEIIRNMETCCKHMLPK